MRVIIDTNVLISCIGSKTKYHSIWQHFLQGNIGLCVSTEILLEYEELLTIKFPPIVAREVMNILSDPEYVTRQIVYYYWNIISYDYDDNKFFDAAVACNADYLVTNDAHFNEAKSVIFPKVNIIQLMIF